MTLADLYEVIDANQIVHLQYVKEGEYSFEDGVLKKAHDELQSLYKGPINLVPYPQAQRRIRRICVEGDVMEVLLK